MDCRNQAPERADGPVDIPAQTKQEITLQLIDQALQWQVPFNVIVADAGYGRIAGFLRGLERCTELLSHKLFL